MRLVALMALLLLAVPAGAEESPPTLLWGFQRGCESLTEVNKHVQRELERDGIKPVDVLVPGSDRMGCQGPACAEQVVKECSLQGKNVRILGGYVDQLANPPRRQTRIRVWVYDVPSGKTAWLDTYCQNCPLTSALPYNSAQMLLNPPFGVVLDSTPQYCKAEPVQPERQPGSNKIFWVVYGKEHHKAAVTASLRKLVQGTGTEEPFEHVGKEYTLGVLKKIVAKDPGAQVFGAEIKEKGAIELFLFDGPTLITQTQMVECPGCEKEELAEKVRQAGMQLLSHCFGDDCGGGGVTRSRPPAEVCVPFLAPQCGGGPLLLSPGTGGDGSRAPEISPRLARLTKGAMWGVFAGTAAGSVALLAANFSGAGLKDVGVGERNNTLLAPAAAMGVASLLVLGVAIPVTILVDRAALASNAPAMRTSALPAGKAAGLQCPK